MSNNLVIVAIPAADDPIWKISSEKIPHLTILFLGDAEKNPKINQIYQFVWHAVNITEHGPFYLDVDRRDVLGEDKADVVHFRKDWSFKWINQFRNQLLQHSDIRTAYDSTEQFPEWQPHLTLGYPETPAHEDKIPDYGFGSVRFDRIAVWTGNYEGPQFRLEWPEREEAMAVAYSDTGKAAVADLLHFGTKGMKWGVRKTNTQFAKSIDLREKGGVGPKGTGPTTRKQFKQVRKGGELNQVVTSKVMNQTTNAAKKDLDKLRKRPEFQNINYKDSNGKAQFDVPKFKKLEAEEARIWTGYLNKTVSKYDFDVEVTASTWQLKPKVVKHADEDILVVKPIRDEDGFLVSVVFVNDELEQSALGEEFILEHFGTKGMRWGVRKAIKDTSRFIQDVSFETKADSEDGRARQAVSFKASSNFQKQDLPKINAKPEYQQAKKLTNRLRHPRDPITKQYRGEAKQAYIKQLEKTANEFTNASNTRQYTIRERGVDLPAEGGDLPTSKYFWDVSTRKIQHAADAFKGTTTVEVIMDDDGFITGLNPLPPEVAQDGLHDVETMLHMAEVGADFLEHVGVKGMRWGIRKERSTPLPVAPQAVSKVPHGAKSKTKIETDGGENQPASSDAIKVAQAKVKLQKSGPAALSNKELQEVANRIELEARVKRAVQPSGQKFVTNLLSTQGKQGANQFVGKQVRKKFALG